MLQNNNIESHRIAHEKKNLALAWVFGGVMKEREFEVDLEENKGLQQRGIDPLAS